MPVDDSDFESPDLDRFVAAQTPVIETVLEELSLGRKRTHWMWFVFPQLRGLGRSTTAQYYGVAHLDEASEYLRHPILGARLVDCTARVIDARPRTARQIFGTPDDLKFRSSMTLFEAVPGAPEIFGRALKAFYDGPDAATLSLLDV